MSLGGSAECCRVAKKASIRSMQVLNKDVEQEIVSVEDDVDKNGALKTTLRE